MQGEDPATSGSLRGVRGRWYVGDPFRGCVLLAPPLRKHRDRKRIPNISLIQHTLLIQQQKRLTFISSASAWESAWQHQSISARLVLRSRLRGQTLRGLTPQNDSAKNPATLEEHRKDRQMSTLLRKEIWPQGCGRPNGSRSARLRHLASHSPVAKSPYGAELTFVHFGDVPSVFRGSLWGYFAGFILARFDPTKNSTK